MISKSLTQFSVGGWSCVPSLLFDLRPNYSNDDNGDLLQNSHACSATINAPNPAAGHHRPTPPLKTPGHSWESLGQSLMGSLLLSPGSWCTQGSVCALQESVSLFLCKFWQLHGGVNSDLPQEGLCHTQVCCTQSPCPAAGHADPDLCRRHSDTVCLSLRGVLGPGAHKVCLSPLSVSGRYFLAAGVVTSEMQLYVKELTPSIGGPSFKSLLREVSEEHERRRRRR